MIILNITNYILELYIYMICANYSFTGGTSCGEQMKS